MFVYLKNAWKAKLEFEHFLRPDVLGVGGSGIQRQEIAKEPSCTPSMPLGGSQETHPAQEDTQPTVESVASDETDMANYIIAFPGATHVSSMGTTDGTFLVNDEGVPIKHIQLPGKF